MAILYVKEKGWQGLAALSGKGVYRYPDCVDPHNGFIRAAGGYGDGGYWFVQSVINRDFYIQTSMSWLSSGAVDETATAHPVIPKAPPLYNARNA